jgi:hypothetical protein
VPFREAATPRELANLLGVTYVAEDFDDPLPADFLLGSDPEE